MRKILASAAATAAIVLGSAGMAAADEFDYTGSYTEGTYGVIAPQGQNYTVPVNTVLPFTFKNVPAGTYTFTVTNPDSTLYGKKFTVTVDADGTFSTDVTAPSTPILGLKVSVTFDDAATEEVESTVLFSGTIDVTDSGTGAAGDETDGDGDGTDAEEASNETSGELAAGDTASDEELASTGAGNMGLVAGAAGLLVAGAGAVVVAARRRQN
ncbi:LPXTG cell wall anchor domain-containing protein [Demequina sp. NBRC 110054]|uniref:LPXTG cell wall anchor domain-containing protein n=1 Tax=Demequina sp. NBRC 110054 TaxID=1570343 RepID=UPI0013567001|nr:LPXTG cell wall anchor domain-containing protein [Demequina sp. NBRC 110054]